jgi:hypothetical protein
MTHFNGDGDLSQVDFVLSSPNAPNPNPVEFQGNEKGHYTVYADCTGTFTLNFPSGAIVVTKFVISNGGRAIHTVVSSLTPPGAAGPVPALIRSEGHKL